MNEKKVLVCVDYSLHAKDACDYGIYIAKTLDLPLVLLNVIEHHHLPKHINLAGNIGIGSQEKLLEELSHEEALLSKTFISNGRKRLQELSAYAKEQGIDKIHTIQRHGNFEETLDELSNETKIAIIGLELQESKDATEFIKSHVETVVRTLNIPILLVNAPFKPIDSILMAYDGSDFANKAIQVATQDPIFPHTKRHVVNVNKEEKIGFKLLSDAVNIFKKSSLEVQPVCLQGEPVEALLQYQEKNKLDIIAMGAYGHNRFRNALFGSFTSKMILKAKTPLLLFR